MERVLEYFPYPSFRLNQDKLAESTALIVEQGGHLVVDGASGLGKTIAVLAGTLPGVIAKGLKLVYLARTHKQLDRVVEELKEVSSKKSVSGFSLRSKLDMCINENLTKEKMDHRTLSEICEELKRSGRCIYYENIFLKRDQFTSLLEQLTKEPKTALEIVEIGKKFEICPYELARSALRAVQVVAASYLHVFDRSIRESFLSGLGVGLSSLVLILDEAHNLPEVCIEVESDSVSERLIEEAIEEADRYGKADFIRFYEELQCFLRKISLSDGEVVLENPLATLAELLKKAKLDISDVFLFVEEMRTFGEMVKKHKLARGKLPRSYILKLAEFLSKYVEACGKDAMLHIVSEKEVEENELVRELEVIALDPRLSCEEVLKGVYASVSLSGTLKPTEAYVSVMGLPENAIQLSLPSPFPRRNILALATAGLSTVYRRRGTHMYAKLIEAIAEVAEYTPANVGVFCPSYEVLENLVKSGLKEALKKPLFIEKRFAEPFENDRILAEFKSCSETGGAVLLGVVGGRFSEGEDYPGNEMNSVVIVGVPYAKPSPRIKAQIRYYEERFPGFGRELAYIIPAMRKASQAAGRPFRSPEDRGAIIMLDYRFATRYCRRFLPNWIKRRLRVIRYSKGRIAQELMMFFGLSN